MFNYISYIYTSENETVYGHVEVETVSEVDTSWVEIVRGMTRCKDPILEYISPPYGTRVSAPSSFDPEHEHTHCQNVSFVAGNIMRTVEVGLDLNDADGTCHFEKKYAAVKAICARDVMPVIINVTPPYRSATRPTDVAEAIETVSLEP